MATLQGKSCGPYLSVSAMRFMKRWYTNVRSLPFLDLTKIFNVLTTAEFCTQSL